MDDLIKITDDARQKIISVLEEEKADLLRLGLQGGGCSGFQYFFAIEDTSEISDDEYKISLNESKNIVVDAMSMTYLSGSEIDYQKDTMGERFIFNNPNATSSCGCGKSYSF